eukprot:sb/3472401/
MATVLLTYERGKKNHPAKPGGLSRSPYFGAHPMGALVDNFSMVTDTVAMATVLLTLKGAKGATRQSRVGCQKALTRGAPDGWASLYYKLKMNVVEVVVVHTKILFPGEINPDLLMASLVDATENYAQTKSLERAAEVRKVGFFEFATSFEPGSMPEARVLKRSFRI